MKKIQIFLILCLSLWATSCDNGFDKLNIDPNGQTIVDPAFQLNAAIVNSAFGYNNLQYETIIVKQMINPYSGVGAAGQYNQDNRGVTAANWIRGYRQVIRELVDVIDKTRDQPTKSNLYNMSRIWKAYAFMLLTDTYGDIPYRDAGKSFLEGIVSPAYDPQEQIYQDLLVEIETATAALDNTKARVTSDVLFAGDIVRWKKFGYSLLLRAGMRLSKVNPTKAAETVAKAVQGGLMTSNSDNAMLKHSSNFANPVGAQLNGGQADFFYLASDFVSFLQLNKDPRLNSIAVRYVGAKSSVDQKEVNAKRTSEVQIGMPLGYDNTTVSAAVKNDGLVSLYDYSQLDRTRMAGLQSPTIFLTFSQTQLLLAEAVIRKWANGDANSLYTSGIRAHMGQLSSYGASVAIPEASINSFLENKTLGTGKELEQINTQYWVASFLNGPEAWANFRRSDFPLLTPNPFPGSDLKTETFIRRLTYTDAELNVNKNNVEAAIKRQGLDLLDTRVWWDKK